MNTLIFRSSILLLLLGLSGCGGTKVLKEPEALVAEYAEHDEAQRHHPREDRAVDCYFREGHPPAPCTLALAAG